MVVIAAPHLDNAMPTMLKTGSLVSKSNLFACPQVVGPPWCPWWVGRHLCHMSHLYWIRWPHGISICCRPLCVTCSSLPRVFIDGITALLYCFQVLCWCVDVPRGWPKELFTAIPSTLYFQHRSSSQVWRWNKICETRSYFICAPLSLDTRTSSPCNCLPSKFGIIPVHRFSCGHKVMSKPFQQVHCSCRTQQRPTVHT